MATTVADPLFDDEDTATAIEYVREKVLSCPGCGLPRDETMLKEAQFAYEASAIRCHACAARDRAASQYTAQEHDSAGLMFTIEEIDG